MTMNLSVPKHSLLCGSAGFLGFIAGVALALGLLLAAGCTPTLPKVPTAEVARQQALKEIKPLVPAETTAKLPPGRDPLAIRKETPAPYTGILLQNDRYATLLAVRADRDRLLANQFTLLVTNRTKDLILDVALKNLAQQARRSWWEKNQLWLGSSLGFVLGVTLVVGLVYGLTGGGGMR
jgi:hypothetical protein